MCHFQSPEYCGVGKSVGRQSWRYASTSSNRVKYSQRASIGIRTIGWNISARFFYDPSTYIHTTSFFGPTYPSTVAIGSEVTHIGIPLEYEPGISSGIEDAISVRSALPSGELRFDRGVHGEIGSDSLIFRYLSYIVFGLFEFIEDCPDDDLITSFVYKSLCTKLQNERSAMLRSEIEFGQERSRMESTI